MRVAGYQRIRLSQRPHSAGQATIVVRHRVSGRALALREGPSAVVRRRPTNGTYAHRGRPAVTRDRSMRVAGYQHVRLSQRHYRAGQATIMIRHRVSGRTLALREGPRAVVRRRPTNGTYAHRSRPTVTRDRSMRVAGHQRIRLSQRHYRAGHATIVVRHRVSGRALSLREGPRAVVRRRPTNGTYAHRSRPTVTRDRSMRVAGHQ